jgi:hypothetical protein
MKRYKLKVEAFMEPELVETKGLDYDYVEAAHALAWKRYALALEALAHKRVSYSEWLGVNAEKEAAHAALVALGEVEG